MKRLLLLIGFTFSLTMDAQAPAIEWQKAMGGTGDDRAYSIQQTTDGGYILAGQTNSNDGDVTGYQGGNYDVWVVKLSSTGIIQWQKTLGGTGNDYAQSIQQTTDGGYIVAGQTNSNDGDVTGYQGGIYDFWVVKISTTGTIQWQKTLGGTGDDYAQSIQQTTDGGYIVAGFTGSNNSGDVTGFQGYFDCWVVKISTTGEIQWQKTFGGTGMDFAQSIQQTTDGGYIVAGSTGSNNSGNVTGFQGYFDYWVVKISTTGEIQWQKTLGGTESDSAYSIKQTTDGGYIVAGQTNSNDGDVTGFQGGTYDVWVVKLSSTGIIQWQKTLGGTGSEYTSSIQQTSDGDYIVAGNTSSNDGDVTGNYGIVDNWIVKLSTLGTIQWQKTFGGTEVDSTYSIQQTTDGDYIVVGETNSNDGDVSGNHGGYDVWIVKLSSNQMTTSEFSSTGLNLYPNPTHSLINIQTSNNTGLDKISITDLTGKKVMEQTQNTNQVSVEKLASGVYILNGYSEGNKFQEKFIKE